MANVPPPVPPPPTAPVITPTSPDQSPPRHTLNRPNLRDLLRQAYRDFVGKDVQQTTTYSYVWSADQAGHVMLGFVPTFFLYWIGVQLDWKFDRPWATGGAGILWSAIWVLLAWTVLELFDFFQSARMIQKSKGYFRGNYLNLAWNVITALYYFSLGAVLLAVLASGLPDGGAAGLGELGPIPWAVGLLESRLGLSGWWAAFLLAVLFLAVIPLLIARWWLRRKIIFQQAGLPYLYRLPNYDGQFKVHHDEEEKKKVVAFINAMRARPKDKYRTEPGATDRRHLIVCGPPNSGKTSLAVGIGTEFAFVGGIGRYVTMSNLVQHIASRVAAESRGEAAPPQGSLPSDRTGYADPTEHEFNDGRILWQWPSVDLLVIDDVIELLLPVRREIERELDEGKLHGEVEKLVLKDEKLVADLGGRERAVELVARFLPPLQQRLKELAQPEVVARLVADMFREVIGHVRQIPRVVWVLGDMILPHLFEDFIRDLFGFRKSDAPDFRKGVDHPERLMVVELEPPQSKNGG